VPGDDAAPQSGWHEEERVAMSRLSDPDAVVVGSGPNGLAAALALARQGFKVTVLEAADEPGGGTRTYEDPAVPGLLHDHCSAVHPMAIGSPFLRTLPLDRYGLTWCHPEIPLAHPLDDEPAAILHRDLAATLADLDEDAPVWEGLFGHAARNVDAVVESFLGPVLRVPRHPLVLARHGPGALLPASVIAKAFRTQRAAALFGGIAAHSFGRLDQPLTSAIALVFIAASHGYGWPVPQGGSQAIWKAMVAYLEDLGSEVVTGVHVRDFSELPRARVALFDTSPTGLAHILGDRLPAPDRRRAERWTYGPAAYKLDLAIRGSVPWKDELARRAGTLHLGGTFDEIAEGEAATVAGELPERPFMLVSQPHVADPSREVDGITPLWSYAHVPHACAVDVAPLMEAQLERFAPGISDQIVARNVITPADFEAANPNLHGGDITGGASTPRQLVARPRLSTDPYATAVPGVFLCSASTAPAAGVHGMCGYHAARSALRVLTA
jgi:phytoene dehydrogenase-like protein